MVTEGRTVSPKEVMMAAPTLDSAGISELLLAVSSACCCVQLTMDRADSCQAGSMRNTTRAKYYRIPCRRTYGGTHSSALSSMSVFSRLNAKNRFRDLSTRTAQKLSGSQPTILGYLRPKLSSRPRDSDMSKLIQGFARSVDKPGGIATHFELSSCWTQSSPSVCSLPGLLLPDDG